MKIDIGGVKLWFDVEGAKLVPDGPEMKERPTLLLLHGGPGFDHSHLKPALSELSDVAQCVFLEHRGNGRSDRCSPETWNLAQWGDDVYEFCQALGIEKPIVMGVSFGGFVAQSYAIRHPEHPAKLILSSTSATLRRDRIYDMFESLGGAEARQLAETFWSDARNADILGPYIESCLPLYNQTPQGTDWVVRSIMNAELLGDFFKPGGEGFSFDFRPDLAKVQCPTLVMTGEMDPVTPPPQSEDIFAALPDGLAEMHIFKGCGHGVERDDKNAALKTIREFIGA
ncbi:MAG TPA: alpha/beta hydrolase [Alphaproteobacteria bacterium]|nr:alpha/beta hydrolase [Alphaproteobacteria bacterium]